jgi:serine/threonine protein kinase/tetratricopeptide (TPR) repeat protein
LKALFLEALERPEASERAAYLDGACRGDAALRAQVDELMEAHGRAGGFLGSAAEAAPTAAGGDPTLASGATAAVATAPPTTAVHVHEPATEAPGPGPGPNGPAGPRAIAEGSGTRIGPYRLLQKLGEGGMGAVFLAEQVQPVRRQVALKVIKPGLDTEQVVARFGAERQALALMDHPNIARVYDAGATDSGRPFFVMERVDGVPMNEYCDRERLSPRQRLELFLAVCQAIQHAHQKGIIHRDIKPSNVLVTVQDGQPVPKVIDFGVAKAIDQRLTERTLFTQLGALVGTPEYMSPEQADYSGGGIDTRSDIYSLGALLYELLTGTTPLGRVRLREAAFSEILRRIREEEPHRPSTRLSDSGEALASIAACRDIEPARLTKLVRGDLDWIAMKALEKDRSRRYATAQELARDVRRYLDGDPVEAGPPSVLYRAGKYARKHRAAFAIAGMFLLLLVGASVVSTWLMLRARSAERLAEWRLDELQKAHAETTAALAETERARERARAEADKATAVNDFLTQDLLTQAEPENSAAEDHVTLLEVLDRAAAKAGERFADRSEVEDALRRTIARTYHGLASWENAERQWRAVLDSARRRGGSQSAEALTAQSELSHILCHRGRPVAEVFEMARAASEGLPKVLGPDHPDTLIGRNFFAIASSNAGRVAEAIALHEAILKPMELRLGPVHHETLCCRSRLARAYLTAGRIAEAIALVEATVKVNESKLGLGHLGTLLSRRDLASAYRAAGRVAEAISLLEATLKPIEASLGLDNPSTLACRLILASAYRAAGRVAEAISLLKATLKESESRSGPDHRNTLDSVHWLAHALEAGRPAEAEPLFRRALDGYRKLQGPIGPLTVDLTRDLASLLERTGRRVEAVALHEATLKQQESKLGPDHPETFQSRHDLATAYRNAGRVSEAVALHEATLKQQESKLGPDHPDTLAGAHDLADALEGSQPAAAEPLFRRALDGYRKLQGPVGPLTLHLTRDLASLLERTGRPGEAEPLLHELLDRQRANLPAGGLALAGTLAPLGMNLLNQRKWSEAETVLRECLSIRQKDQPDDWSTFNTRSQLGGALLGQRKFAEAEPLILAGYEGLKAREDRIPPPGRPRLAEAARRVIELYQAWGRSDKAAAWRAGLGLAELPVEVFAPR